MREHTVSQCVHVYIIPVAFQMFILVTRHNSDLNKGSNVTLVTISDVTATHVAITPLVRQSGLIGRHALANYG